MPLRPVLTQFSPSVGTSPATPTCCCCSCCCCCVGTLVGSLVGGSLLVSKLPPRIESPAPTPVGYGSHVASGPPDQPFAAIPPTPMSPLASPSKGAVAFAPLAGFLVTVAIVVGGFQMLQMFAYRAVTTGMMILPLVGLAAGAAVSSRLVARELRKGGVATALSWVFGVLWTLVAGVGFCIEAVTGFRVFFDTGQEGGVHRGPAWHYFLVMAAVGGVLCLAGALFALAARAGRRTHHA